MKELRESFVRKWEAKCKVNSVCSCIKYPRSNHFGKWAWCTKDYDRAVVKINKLE